jgi:multidrug transporter EmrE-like cation transporter
MHWILLAVGIAIELVATTALKLSDGFTKPAFAVLTLTCFAVAFYVMALVVRTMPLGIAYSVWAGGGIAGVTLIGALVFGQEIDGYGYLGIGLIMAGVIVLNALSLSASGQRP